MKLAVVYDSITGNTKKAAEWIAEGMNEIEGAEAMAFSIHEADEAFIKESRGIVIGSPSYMAQLTPDMHSWIMSESGELGFGGKLGGAFATEQYTHGGGDLVLQSILTMEMVSGMICYSGGNSLGVPYIHLGPVAVNTNKEKHNGLEYYRENFVIFGKRFAKKAVELERVRS